MSDREASPPLTILHITDTHLHAATDSRMRGVRTHDTFVAVLSEAMRDTKRSPDAILVTGDIVQDESRAGYERFRATLTAYDRPVLCIPGNHDDPHLMDQLLSDPPFQVGGETAFGPWTLVLLNTFLTGEDAGGLGERRLKSLDKSLHVHVSQHVLVCMHHHALPMGSRWLDGVGLRDSAAFLDVIDRHDNVRGVVCGHVHQASDRERGAVRHLSTPSTCSQFMPGSESFLLDNRPPGFRWLRLHGDGRIETEVRWIDT